MTEVEDTLTSKQLASLTLIGLSLLILFAAGFAWFYYYVGILGHGGVDVFIAFTPFCFFPYLTVISIYVGFFTTKFAKGKWKYPWLWGISSFVLTILLIIGLPLLLESVFPYRNPAIFAFVAPVLSTPLVMLLISIRRKTTI